MPHRIIACDDEIYITRAINLKLSKAGLDIQSFLHGKAAWDAIQEQVPDLLITDYQMPQMDGLELIQKLRENARTKEVPVILLTAKGFELDAHCLLQTLKVSRVVIKPFSPRELLSTVQEILESVVPATDPAGTSESSDSRSTRPHHPESIE